MHRLTILLIHIVQILIANKLLLDPFSTPSVYGGGAGYRPPVLSVVDWLQRYMYIYTTIVTVCQPFF